MRSRVNLEIKVIHQKGRGRIESNWVGFGYFSEVDDVDQRFESSTEKNQESWRFPGRSYIKWIEEKSSKLDITNPIFINFYSLTESLWSYNPNTLSEKSITSRVNTQAIKIFWLNETHFLLKKNKINISKRIQSDWRASHLYIRLKSLIFPYQNSSHLLLSIALYMVVPGISNAYVIAFTCNTEEKAG